ncbi:hypothetical protein BJV78DRAFT_625553 [Lactifluus subvellereus]|nr:hypothetical protein BJV78DRAFT_625553 [Lactifluus subvellereus]
MERNGENALRGNVCFLCSIAKNPLLGNKPTTISRSKDGFIYNIYNIYERLLEWHTIWWPRQLRHLSFLWPLGSEPRVSREAQVSMKTVWRRTWTMFQNQRSGMLAKRVPAITRFVFSFTSPSSILGSSIPRLAMSHAFATKPPLPEPVLPDIGILSISQLLHLATMSPL